MAQPIIYTGQGASQALQGGGQSLQALGQFAQANQQLKRDELTKAVKDQDNILEMLKLDPVYSASMGAQEQIAKGIEDFTSSATKIVQDAYSKGGKLSTMDMNKIQQLKGVAMGRLNMFKAGQEQMLQAQKAISANPSRYYEPDFYEAVEDFQKTGIWQDGLTPAYRDNRQALAEDKRFEQNIKSTSTWDNNMKRWVTSKVASSGLTPEKKREVGIGLLYNDPEYKLNWIRDWKGMVERGEQKKYEDLGKEWGMSGIEAFAASDAERFLSQDKEVPGTAYGDPYANRNINAMWRIGNGSLYDENNTVMLSYDENLSDAMGNKGRGIRLNNDGGSMTYEVPAEDLTFSGGIKFPKGSMVWVIPQYVIDSNGKRIVSYTLNPTKNKNIVKTYPTQKDAYLATGQAGKMYLKSTGEEVTGVNYMNLSPSEQKQYEFKVEQKVDTNISATGDLANDKVNLNMYFNNKFDEFYNKYLGASKSTTQPTTSKFTPRGGE